MLLSSQFSESVTELCGDGVERACYSIVCSRASSGSILIPHKDTVAGSTSNDRENFINIIFFVDANGPEGAELGATGIYRDNQFAEPILIPPTLKNSALIYKSSADFFHGFPKGRMFKPTKGNAAVGRFFLGQLTHYFVIGTGMA